MDNNHADNYVLVLEDRMEVKNEVEVGKLSVVSNIDEKGKLKSALPKKQPLFSVKQPIALFQGIFSPKHRTLSRECRTLSGRRRIYFRECRMFSWICRTFSPKHRTFSWKCRMFFGGSHGIVRKRSLKFVWECAVGEWWCVTNCEFLRLFSLSHARVRVLAKSFMFFAVTSVTDLF